tara:strand:+ start:460 stop:744 length:285 start_codon:yes stop_codon:yes gene_type:complete
MEIVMPWSDWFVKEARKRKKIHKWTMADVSLEEELKVETFLRHVINCLEPDDIPDLISAFAKENYRLVKIIEQAGLHIDKIEKKTIFSKSKHNP